MAKTYRVIPTLTAQEQKRFWKYVDKSPGHGPNGDCWIWIAGKYGRVGYGGFRIRDFVAQAHRIAYFLFYSRLDNALLVCHACDNRLCCNPAHLWQGAYGDNTQDMIDKGRHWMRQRPEDIRRGDEHPYTKIPDAEVSKIRKEYARGLVTYAEIAARYGVTKACIYRIVHRLTRCHLP